jgi:biopolymer transport protein ExbD
LQKSIEVPRPDPDQEGATQSIQTPEDLQENSIIVRIDENDDITIDFEPVGDVDNLADLLLDKRRIEQKGDLVIDADENATHGRVVEVNDAAVEAEFQHIRLAVRGSSN